METTTEAMNELLNNTYGFYFVDINVPKYYIMIFDKHIMIFVNFHHFLKMLI